MPTSKREWPPEIWREYRVIQHESRKFSTLLEAVYGEWLETNNPYLIRDHISLLRGYLLEIDIQVDQCRAAQIEGRIPQWVYEALGNIERKSGELHELLDQWERLCYNGREPIINTAGLINYGIRRLRFYLAAGPAPSQQNIVKYRRKAS